MDSSAAISKTSRLLVVFHLFQHCQEVSFQEITNMLPVSRKTAYRDIQLLKQAGVLQIRYSRRQEAFVPVSLEFTEPEQPENQTLRRRADLQFQIPWLARKYCRSGALAIIKSWS